MQQTVLEQALVAFANFEGLVRQLQAFPSGVPYFMHSLIYTQT